MQLLERAEQLEQLQSLLSEAAEGNGHVAVLVGEAGAGKSALVNIFTDLVGKTTRVLRGACENFGTAEPLGPLRDLVREAGWALSETLSSTESRIALFSEVFRLLSVGAPTSLIVIEDIHWADDATLNLIRYLGRRIRDAHVLILLTARDDDVGLQSRLRKALGDIPAASQRRIDVPALSRAAVSELAMLRGFDGDEIFRVTGGNAYFITELIEAGDWKVMPRTVRDAVLARAEGLTAPDRDILAAASIFPDAVDLKSLDAICGDGAEKSLQACLDCGLMRRVDGTYSFRHEITRQVIEQSLSPIRRRGLNATALAASRHAGHVPWVRLIHHANEAQDLAAICELAPQAAAEAARLGAHREAIKHYELALTHASAFDEKQRADLYEHHAFECHLVGQVERAIVSQKKALAIHHRLGAPLREGESLRWLSRLSYLAGNRKDSDAYGKEAVDLLEAQTEGAELAMAYSNLSQLSMLAGDTETACHYGERAIGLAQSEAIGRPDILCHALNNVGTAVLWRDPDQARQLLGRSLEIALAHQLEEHAARSFTNRGWIELRLHSVADAEDFLGRGISYCIEHDLDTWRDYMRGEQAELFTYLGRWDEAERAASLVVGNVNAASLSRYPNVLALAVLRTRRGEPADALLEELSRFLETGRELQRLAPYAELVAERAWLGLEDIGRALSLLDQAIALSRDDAAVSLLLVWKRKLGADVSLCSDFDGDEVVRQMLAGDWAAAAETWNERGSPYWQAMTLLDGDDNAVYHALDLLEGMGASAVAQHVRAIIRGRLGRVAARGPRASTKANPAGLTMREMDVLRWIDLGKSNGEIAALLFVSAKTVDHHVSSILAKLNARTRTAAASHARSRGLLS
ncbi:LuxR family transcriptional regulator [Rhizobium leguminosarum]|uniref:ATP-binding protein n=1 Tax=Rhizobium leguminosarum TaxID=384 RepID=UPI000FF73ECF|nr:LuxR family transcriptional regulator [Rhizobium leguminosarum]RWY66097.1 LuxR family transcriptional regulator [Rhizobium leguminosarum]